ncbi:3-keto-disaccharide hydrolase [Roseibacillus ishigakijimensis]|uniref:DUF1080 domain-containing protein n=1 Tax=Roseibacillus ishigakijimensis TaxID=454146 RepID=A0A934VLJ8_9BACT|nr:DUF1080 domain-containing protein [Roseibacillus ishigakijimensis]MBK1833312.1 DUF1080 domain-containing protein [Roseibacillus ishigakijimensis]
MKKWTALVLMGLAGMAWGDWVNLSDGKDLTGWKDGQGATEVAGYTLSEGVITSRPGCSNLMTAKEYSDYIFEFDFKLTPGANNGLGIHYPGQGDPAYAGMELQILDNTAEKYQGKLKDYQWHGSLYTLSPALRGHLKPVGEWNSQRVTVRGPHVTVELNGITILKANLDELNESHPKHKGAQRRQGRLTFCGHGDVVSWRNVRICEIPHGEDQESALFQPAGKKDDTPGGLGFQNLLAEGSLSQWKMSEGQEGHWTLVDGWKVAYDGQSEAKDKNLWSQAEFGDFELICDWRFAGEGPRMERPIILPNGLEMRGPQQEVITEEVEELDSGLYLRGSATTQINMWNWPVGSGEVYGVRTSAVGLPYKAAVTPRVKADNPSGEWNRFFVRMVGKKLTVYLNGKCVLFEATLPPAKDQGPIALQHHGAAMEFGNLWVKEL